MGTRRFLFVLLPIAVMAGNGWLGGTGTMAGAAGAAGAPPVEDPKRGVIYDGLVASDACGTGFALASAGAGDLRGCVHGPDPAPDGVDVRVRRAQPGLGATQADASAAAAATVPCAGDGSDGYRLQLIYARASDTPDNYAGWLPSFRLWASQVDDVFNLSAAETGGTRHIRYVHDASCVATVDNVELSPFGDDNFDSMLSELRDRGYDRTDRKYLVYTDANVYCGIAQVYYDDRPGQENYSNGHFLVPGEVGRVDQGCWGNTSAFVEAHELTHLLGGVQTSAPNATFFNHCSDEYDRLCYNDGGARRGLRYLCPAAHENRLDCNHDDYFSTDPQVGSYLFSHWNVASSRFLTATGPAPPPPTTTTTTAPPATTTPATTTPATTTTSTTTPATTTTSTTTTTTTPTSTTTTSTTTTVPTTVPTTTSVPPGAPSAPLNVYAVQPITGSGVIVRWSPPSSPGGSPVSGYRIYRGPSPTSLTLLATVGPGAAQYADTATTPRALYWYYVTAVNGAGSSPPSNLTRMIAR